MFLGPRVVLFFAWLFTDWYAAFDARLVALAGWLFLPWTSLAWIVTQFHNGGRVDGGYLVLLILGILADVGVFGGAAKARSNDGASWTWCASPACRTSAGTGRHSQRPWAGKPAATAC